MIDINKIVAKVLRNPQSSKAAKTKQGSALSQRKVLRAPKEGKITRAAIKAAVKAVAEKREED